MSRKWLGASKEGGHRGTNIREAHVAADGLRRVDLIGETDASETLNEEQWLIFARPVKTDATVVGHAEIAFLLNSDAGSNTPIIKNVTDSLLAAFFPTSVRANLGFLIQAPFRTTPARDNIPYRDQWNQFLLSELASLLIDSLEGLKKQGLLSVEVLCGMPLNEVNFGEGSMLRPLFDKFSEALRTKELLPSYKGGFLLGSGAILARGQELCDLLDTDHSAPCLTRTRPWNGSTTRLLTTERRNFGPT